MATTRTGRVSSTPRKLAASPTRPVKAKPPTPGGGERERKVALAPPRPTGHCFLTDYDHNSVPDYEMELFDTTVQIPGSSVEAKVKICLFHKTQMDALRKNQSEAVRAMAIAPYGRCHVCELPVGVRDEYTPRPDKPGDTVPCTYWEHMNDTARTCHEQCRCSARVGVCPACNKEYESMKGLDFTLCSCGEPPVDKKVPLAKVGRHRVVVLV